MNAVPFMMQANLNDDINYNPEKRPRKYARLVLSEIEYERTCLEHPDPTYTKEELDEAEEACNKVLE